MAAREGQNVVYEPRPPIDPHHAISVVVGSIYGSVPCFSRLRQDEAASPATLRLEKDASLSPSVLPLVDFRFPE